MSADPPDVVTATVEVALDPATAFAVFTEEIGHWWRPGPINWNHPGRAVGIQIEPGVGGRWIEVHDLATGEGFECGRITVWEPGVRFVFLYRDAGRVLDGTEVEVRFEAILGGTRVTLEHRGWEQVAQDLAAGKREVKRWGWANILGWFKEWAFWGTARRVHSSQEQDQSTAHAAFDRVAILGLGLMGASLGLALRAAGAARTIAGYDAAAGVAARAQERGAIDEPAADPTAAVAAADLVVLAVPVLAMRELLAAIAPHLAPGALVTDLGSTKSAVVAWAAALLPDPPRFIGGHPMTGRERAGVDAADPTLYQGCVWCLTPTERTEPDALARLTALVERLGARPLTLEPRQHDAAVAAVSHLPLLAATALTLTAAARPDWPTARSLAAGGFRDTTRVASGDPRMARDICLTNTQPIVDCLDAYLATLQRLRDDLAAGDSTIEQMFLSAKDARDTWLARPRD